jgi:hypothetical protein
MWTSTDSARAHSETKETREIGKKSDSRLTSSLQHGWFLLGPNSVANSRIPPTNPERVSGVRISPSPSASLKFEAPTGSASQMHQKQTTLITTVRPRGGYSNRKTFGCFRYHPDLAHEHSQIMKSERYLKAESGLPTPFSTDGFFSGRIVWVNLAPKSAHRILKGLGGGRIPIVPTENCENTEKSRVFGRAVVGWPACLSTCVPSSRSLPADSAAGRCWKWRALLSITSCTFFVASGRFGSDCLRLTACSGSGSTAYGRAVWT